MRFAIVDNEGTIQQINDALGDIDTVDQINARLAGELTAIICDQGIQLNDKYDFNTKQFITQS